MADVGDKVGGQEDKRKKYDGRWKKEGSTRPVEVGPDDRAPR